MFGHNSQMSEEETLADEWDHQGLVVLHGAVDSSWIDDADREVAAFRSSNDELKDEHGYGDRIGQFHQMSSAYLRLASSPRILSFLRFALKDDPLLFGSLNFERGSQQGEHIDSIFFYTEPSYAMCGVWLAMEDVKEDAGPLFYIPGSHKWTFARGEELVAQHPDLAEKVATARENPDDPTSQKLVEQLGRLWSDDLNCKIATYNGQRQVLCPKRGDCVIWHALLAHGGTPRRDPTLSRRSAVFHYIGRNSRLYTFQDFFLKTNQEILDGKGLANNIISTPDLEYIKFNYVVKSTKSGQEVVTL